MVSQEEQESHEILKPIPKYPFRINARDTKIEANNKHKIVQSYVDMTVSVSLYLYQFAWIYAQMNRIYYCSLSRLLSEDGVYAQNLRQITQLYS